MTDLFFVHDDRIVRRVFILVFTRPGSALTGEVCLQ